MKAKIDLEKFICSMLNDSKTNAGYVHAKSIERALKEQGMEYKDGEIVEIGQEQPSEKDYEDLSIINEGDDGVLLYFTKDGRGISDFRISKDTARWLHGRLEEYLEMYDDEQPIEQEEREDLRKRYEKIGKSDWFKKTHEGMSVTIPDDLEGTDTDGGVVGEKGEQGEPETLEEKVEHWQRMHDIAMEKIKGTFKEEDSPETKAIKEYMENIKKHIEDNQLGCIVQRLDKIIELLSWKPSPNIIPYPYTMTITYDTNKTYCDATTSTEGGEE